MLDALTDLHHWLTPEVMLTCLVVALTGWLIVLVYGDRAYRAAEKLPRITLQVSPTHRDGWHHCLVSVKNRLDSPIEITRASVVPWQGFVLAKSTSGEIGTEPDLTTPARAINPSWYCGQASQRPLDRVLYIKLRGAGWLKRGIATKIKFTVLVQDAERKTGFVTARSNRIRWDQ